MTFLSRSNLSRVVILGVGLFAAACSSSSDSTTPSASGTQGAGGSGGGAGGSGGGAGGTGGGSSGGSGGGGGASSSGITGTLGMLGSVQPTMSSHWISNSGETLVYLSSGPVTCQDLMTSRWLGGTTAGSQVIELVFKGAPALGDIAVPPGEVNYAEGGKSSAYEVSAASGKISITKSDAVVLEGTFQATYDDGSSVSGPFHAEFCDGGQGY